MNAFGSLPEGQKFDYTYWYSLVPETISEEIANRSASIQMRYADYMASEANLQAVLVEMNQSGF